MKKFLTGILVAITLLIAAPVNAEVANFEGKGTYYHITQKDSDEFHELAKQKAMQDALEKASAYIRNYSRARNFTLTDKEILSLAADTAELWEESWVSPTFANGNLIVYGTIELRIDTKNIDDLLNRDANEWKVLVYREQDFQKKLNEQIAEFAERDRQLAELKKKLAEHERTVKEDTPVSAQQVGEQIFEGIGEYRIGSYETIIDAERGAKFLAMQDALTKADIPVYTYVDVKSFEPDKDFTTPKGRAVLKIVDVETEWNDFVCRMKVKVDINVKELKKWLKQAAKKSK